MKRFINYFVIIFVILFMGIISVKAADGAITKTGFSWSGVSEYSVSKLKCTNVTFSNASDITSANVLKSSTGSVTFNNPKNVTVTCTIYIAKELTGNDEDQELVSKTITIGTTATSTKKEETTTAATQANKSNNNNLKTLKVKTSDGEEVSITPSFSSSVYEYEAVVASNIKLVNIEATMEDSKATMIISGSDDELKAGETNKITITITAEDLSKKAYVINVKREALTANALLKSLKINELPSFSLEEGKTKYKITIPNDVKTLTLEAIAEDENSAITIEGNENLKNGSKVKIIVTAEDGTKIEYTLNIVKKTTTKKTVNVEAEKNPLIIMGLSIIAFGLVGGIIYVIKK